MKIRKKRKDPRQRLGTSQKKSVVTISVRVTTEEYSKIVSTCKDKDITLSEYVRESIIPVYATSTQQL